MIRVDCHFHPNLLCDSIPLVYQEWKVKSLWKLFEQYSLDAVICTEHVFKQPAKTYQLMKKFAPDNASTLLIPGVECLTSEGIDILVWAEDEYVYTHPILMSPKITSFEEIISFIEKDRRLFCSIAHPYVPSKTGVLTHFSPEEVKSYIQRVGVVEKYNGAFLSTLCLFDSVLHYSICGSLRRTAHLVTELPDEFVQGVAYTGGSDGHTLYEVGSYMELDCDIEDIYSALVDKKVKRTMHYLNYSWYVALKEFLASVLIVFYEHTKKTFGFYKTDTTHISKLS